VALLFMIAIDYIYTTLTAFKINLKLATIVSNNFHNTNNSFISLSFYNH